MFDVSVVLLAYNEEENLRKILPQIKEYCKKANVDSEIIVVDTDKPTDNTEAVCVDNGVIYKNQLYPGFGGALRTGIEIASKSHLLTIDSDGAHNPKYIPMMIEMFSKGESDVVIGSRYVKGGGTQDPKINIIMSKMLNSVYGLAFGISAKDISTNFRTYYTSDLKGLDLKCVNYDVLQEILIKIKAQKGRKLKISEFPIMLEKRISGSSKRKLMQFIISYIKTLVSLKAQELHDAKL